jgi:hypothetical protein
VDIPSGLFHLAVRLPTGSFHSALLYTFFFFFFFSALDVSFPLLAPIPDLNRYNFLLLNLICLLWFAPQ